MHVLTAYQGFNSCAIMKEQVPMKSLVSPDGLADGNIVVVEVLVHQTTASKRLPFIKKGKLLSFNFGILKIFAMKDISG